MRGLLGTGPPDLTLESASPFPPHRGPFDHQYDIEIGSNQEIAVESMPNRPPRRGGRGRFEGEVRGACA